MFIAEFALIHVAAAKKTLVHELAFQVNTWIFKIHQRVFCGHLQDDASL